MGLKIKLNSIMVDNQDKALRFYTEVLGFAKGKDIDVGHGFRWITVFAADGHPDVKLVLEPNANPAGRTFQAALFEQNIPATAFEVDDLEAEYRRLKALGAVSHWRRQRWAHQHCSVRRHMRQPDPDL